jgi:DNA polymerase-3 subunit alpha
MVNNNWKKNVELVKTESAKLYQEIVDNNYEESIAKQISDDLSTKGNYLFNKSHSALYAVLTLQTAYLKANYPVEFFCALLNQKRDDYGALNKYILDAKEFGV